jgi:hypothetical protein
MRRVAIANVPLTHAQLGLCLRTAPSTRSLILGNMLTQGAAIASPIRQTRSCIFPRTAPNFRVHGAHARALRPITCRDGLTNPH